MNRPLALGDIARVIFGPAYQDHPIKFIDGPKIYISASPDGADFSLLIPGPDGSYRVKGLNIEHSVQFIPAHNIPLTGNPVVDVVILEKLDDYSLGEVCVSNKYVSDLCRDLWKTRLIQQYGPTILNDKPDTLGYYEYYFSLDTSSPIATGGGHTIVLDKQGKVHAFGNNKYGQLGLRNNVDSKVPAVVPFPFPNHIQSVVCGVWHSMFLDVEGHVYACGSNEDGQLGLEDGVHRNVPTVVPFPNHIRGVACGYYHTIFLDSEGHVYACGKNTDGQLGFKYNVDRNVPTMVRFTNRIQRAAGGGSHTIFLDAQGNAYACGRNYFGQLGLKDDVNRDVPTVVEFPVPNRIQRVACGYQHTIFLDAGGHVYACGYNEYGQLGLEDNVHRKVPTVVPFRFPNRIKRVECGARHTMFLDAEGRVYACGSNEHGQLGLEDNVNRNVPTVVPFPNRIQRVACGGYYTIFLDVEGHVYACGYNYAGQLGLGNDVSQNALAVIPGLMAKTQ